MSYTKFTCIFQMTRKWNQLFRTIIVMFNIDIKWISKKTWLNGKTVCLPSCNMGYVFFQMYIRIVRKLMWVYKNIMGKECINIKPPCDCRSLCLSCVCLFTDVDGILFISCSFKGAMKTFEKFKRFHSIGFITKSVSNVLRCGYHIELQRLYKVKEWATYVYSWCFGYECFVLFIITAFLTGYWQNIIVCWHR